MELNPHESSPLYYISQDDDSQALMDCRSSEYQTSGKKCSIRYDTIRYGRLTCAQKQTRRPAESSSRHRNEKNKEKLKTKPSSSEETVGAIVREGSPGVKTTGEDGGE